MSLGPALRISSGVTWLSPLGPHSARGHSVRGDNFGIHLDKVHLCAAIHIHSSSHWPSFGVFRPQAPILFHTIIHCPLSLTLGTSGKVHCEKWILLGEWASFKLVLLLFISREEAVWRRIM